MTIASEISRLQCAKSDIKTAIEGKGVTVGSSDTIDCYSACIDAIESGPAHKFIDYLAVAGGGNGGYGGGGGGGIIERCNFLLTTSEVMVQVGRTAERSGLRYYNGSSLPSIDKLASAGGAGGGVGCDGASGGSGGGAGGYCCSSSSYCIRQGGDSLCLQGHSGGSASNSSAICCIPSGGGGGGGGAGCVGNCSQSGNGGPGYISSISGTSRTYSGGGGGGACAQTPGTGGTGGGGRGGKCTCSGGSGTYYGGGGGGGTDKFTSSGIYKPGYGCQGIVIIRYKTDGSCGITNAFGGCKYTCGDYTIHCFTEDGFFLPLDECVNGFKYLIVGGGGGGCRGGGGGGAVIGGFKNNPNNCYCIIVGSGGGNGYNGTSSCICGVGCANGGQKGEKPTDKDCMHGGSAGTWYGGGYNLNYCCESYGAGGGGGGATEPGCNAIYYGCCSYDYKSSLGCCLGNGGRGFMGYGGGGAGGPGSCGYLTYAIDGGGNGWTNNSACTKATNCGGGGGGSCNMSYAGRGGDGLVEICYAKDGSWGICEATGGTKSEVTESGITLCKHIFTSSGTFCIVC